MKEIIEIIEIIESWNKVINNNIHIPNYEEFDAEYKALIDSANELHALKLENAILKKQNNFLRKNNK